MDSVLVDLGVEDLVFELLEMVDVVGLVFVV